MISIRQISRLSGLAIPVLFSIGTATAAAIHYTLTSGADVITFSLPQNPSPLACAFATDCFSVSPVTVTIDGKAFSTGTVSFYTPADGGALTILVGSKLEVNNDGPGSGQIFSGTLTSPTLETFSNLQLAAVSYGSPILNEGFTLSASLSGSSTPEPTGTFLAGGLFLAATLAARKRIYRPQ
jgi:hypothetical protein